MATKQDQEKAEWSLEEELKINDRLCREDVETLRKFCGTLPGVDLSKVTDNVLVAMIHSGDYDMGKARKTASAHFEIRASLPEIFEEVDLDTELLKNALKNGSYCPLPRRTSDGCRIIFQALRNKDPAVFDHVGFTKHQILTMDVCIHEDPTCPGYVLIGDMDGISMNHLWKSNFTLTKKLMKFSQEGSACKIQQMHMLNASSFTYYMIKLLKPFLSKHVYDSFQFYTVDQMDEFLKVVPRECLPKDYGGDLPELNTLCDEQENWLREVLPKVLCLPKTS